MPHAEEMDGLLEAKRRADRKFDRFVELYGAADGNNLRRLDLGHYMDRARTEIELTEHWLDRLMATLELAIAAARKRETNTKPGNT